jgi:hypothetical protein
MTHAGSGVTGWLLQLYSCRGEHLHTLRVPGGGAAGFAWEGASQRVGLAVGGAVLMAAVRQVGQACAWLHMVPMLPCPAGVCACVGGWVLGGSPAEPGRAS